MVEATSAPTFATTSAIAATSFTSVAASVAASTAASVAALQAQLLRERQDTARLKQQLEAATAAAAAAAAARSSAPGSPSHSWSDALGLEEGDGESEIDADEGPRDGRLQAPEMDASKGEIVVMSNPAFEKESAGAGAGAGAGAAVAHYTVSSPTPVKGAQLRDALLEAARREIAHLQDVNKRLLAERPPPPPPPQLPPPMSAADQVALSKTAVDAALHRSNEAWAIQLAQAERGSAEAQETATRAAHRVTVLESECADAHRKLDELRAQSKSMGAEAAAAAGELAAEAEKASEEKLAEAEAATIDAKEAAAEADEAAERATLRVAALEAECAGVRREMRMMREHEATAELAAEAAAAFAALEAGEEAKAGGLLSTNTQPTLNLLFLLRTFVRAGGC